MSDNSIAANAAQGGWQKRHTVVVTLFFVMFISYIDRVNISVAVLAMQESLDWSESRKGAVLSAFFVGYMLMQIIGGWLSNIYGGKRVLVVALILCSVFTALTPLAAYLWFPLLIAARVGLGLAEAPINPSAYNIFGRWVPASERARSVAFYSSAGFLGTFFALALTGWLVKLYGWEMSFYLFGGIGFIYVFVLNKVISDTPDKVVDTVAKSEGGLQIAAKQIPWLKLISQSAFWALVVSFFCTSWIFYMLLSWMPSYFASSHGLDVKDSGFYSMAPWLIMFVVMNLSGWLSDSLIKHFWTTTRTRKLLTTAGLSGAGCMLIYIRAVSSPEQAMVVLCLAMGFLALAYASQAPNVLDIAPRYADVLFGILNTFGSLPGIIGVALTGLFVQSTGSYDQAFGFAGTLALIGSAVYLIFGTGKKLVD